MWFKMHPWVFPAILAAIGLFYLIIQLPLIFGKPKDGHSHSGVPIIGGIHFLIAGLISPCKWLALLCVLDYAFIGTIYARINPDAYKDEDKDPSSDQ
ncbi:MAG: hypothetical protein K5686_07700 [Lachnospiraceae bacterium]|nr:hypothetical protein [Lachnospiraceae bacterium]